MEYDYFPTGAGMDTLSFNNVAFPDSLVITEGYPQLVVVGTTLPFTVSEYTVTQTFNPPVQISGGNPPYTITITGVSDPRFTILNNGTASAALSITVANFLSGSTYNCNVSMTVADSASNSTTVTGQLQVTIQVETIITVLFQNYTWNISLSSPAEPNLSTLIPNQFMSIPQLGHPPYSYYVTNITLPSGLGTFIQVSPTKRVLAFNLNETNTTSSVSDVNQTLTPMGSYNVTATNRASAPATGQTYVISITLQVVDSKGISSTSTQNLNVAISS